MRLTDFVAIFGINLFGGLMFFAYGMGLALAIGIPFFLLVSELSMLNYLNHGKLPSVHP